MNWLEKAMVGKILYNMSSDHRVDAPHRGK